MHRQLVSQAQALHRAGASHRTGGQGAMNIESVASWHSESMQQHAPEDGAIEQAPRAVCSCLRCMCHICLNYDMTTRLLQRGAAVGQPRPMCWQHQANLATDHCLIKQ